jgi:hypothetical protein
MCRVQGRSEIKVGLAILLFIGAASGFGAEPVPVASAKGSAEGVRPWWVGKNKNAFLKTPKPPIPDKLRSVVAGSQDIHPNAIVQLTIDHGKIVATPVGGNSVLANYLAQWIQNRWIANPKLTGTFTLPMNFR